MKIFLKFLLVFFGIPLAAFSQVFNAPADIVLTIPSQTISRNNWQYPKEIYEAFDVTRHSYSDVGCSIQQTTTIVGGTLVPGYPKTYQTNLPGVGIVFGLTKGDAGGYETAPSSQPMLLPARSGNGQQYRRAQLMAVGPMTAGTITSAPYMLVTYSGSCVPTVTTKVSIALNTTRIMPPSCTVTSKQVNVALPEIKAADLPSVNSTAGNTNFVLALNCPSPTNVNITLTDKNNLANRSNILSLNNSAGNSASGLGVQILRNSAPVRFGPDSAEVGTQNQFLLTTNPSSNNMTFNFSARYIATAVPVRPGSVNATATFTMSYQ